MFLAMLVVFSDGVFAITAEEPADKDSWRLRYVRSESALASLRRDFGSEVGESAWGKVLAELTSDGSPDIDYQGPIVANMYGYITQVSEKAGSLEAIAGWDGPARGQFGLFTGTSDTRTGTCIWSKEGSHVRLFFSRAQGRELLATQLGWIGTREETRAREALETSLLPETDPRPIVAIEGEGAHFICAAIAQLEPADQTIQ